MQIRSTRNILVLCSILLFLFVPSTAAQTSPCANGQESGLLLPGSFLPARLPEIGTN
jgi:hypothetical protein